MNKTISALFTYLQSSPAEVGVGAAEWIRETSWSAKLQGLVSADLCKEVHKIRIEEDGSTACTESSHKVFCAAVGDVTVRIYALHRADASNCLRFLFLLYAFYRRELKRTDAHFFAVLHSCSRMLSKRGENDALVVPLCLSVKRVVQKCKLLGATRDERVCLDNKGLESTDVAALLYKAKQCTEDILLQALVGEAPVLLVAEYGSVSTHELTLLIELSGYCMYATDACVVHFDTKESLTTLRSAYEADLFPIYTAVLSVPGQESQELIRRVKSEAALCTQAKSLVHDGPLDPSMTFITLYTK